MDLTFIYLFIYFFILSIFQFSYRFRINFGDNVLFTLKFGYSIDTIFQEVYFIIKKEKKNKRQSLDTTRTGMRNVKKKEEI